MIIMVDGVMAQSALPATSSSCFGETVRKGAPFAAVSLSLCSKTDLLVQPIAGKKESADRLWREFFSDPSQWWDHRFDEKHSGYPDFRHKKASKSLWMNAKSTPQWVGTQLLAMRPGVVQRSIFFWNSIIARHVKNGQNLMALQQFQQMQREGVRPDKFTFVWVLKACSGLGELEKGRCVHALLAKTGCLNSDLIVRSCLIDMYIRCGSIRDARTVFDNMPIHDVVTWSSMIVGHARNGQGEEALKLYQQMQQQGVEPNSVTFVGVINACASMAAVEEGRRSHEQVMQKGLESDIYVGSCLVKMYCKFGLVEDARRIFNKLKSHDLISWSIMIVGYVNCGQAERALQLFEQMQQEEVEPDSVTFMAVLNACASLSALEIGRHAHLQIIQKNCNLDVSVGNCLVDMYAKCGSINDAWRVFVNMPTHNVVSWSTIIAGLVRCGQGEKALELYHQMQQGNVNLNKIALVSVLSACSSIVALEEGRCVHAKLIQSNYESDVYVGSCLVDMYSKCGSIEDACRVFHNLPARDVVSWNAMLCGYSVHGLGRRALKLFERMQREGVQMDCTSFTCLLNACSHAGLVEEGHYYFESMIAVYGISLKLEHYNCVIDLLGRSGYLDEAWELINGMSFTPDVSVWRTVLGSCRTHGDLPLAERIAKKLLALDPENQSGYVQLSNIYAAAGNWDSTLKI